MQVGKALGYGLVALIDSLLPPVIVLTVVVLVLPVELLESVLPFLLVLGAVSFVVTLVGSLINVRRGGKPFVVTRATKRVFDWLYVWLPHP